MSRRDPLSVVLGLWQDRPAEENLRVACRADELGYANLWIGEMATYDAFALATAVGMQTARIGLRIGPLAVAVRTPMTVAMGVASVAALVGRTVGVAIGTSSDVVVGEWHGRSRERPATVLAEHAAATRRLLTGERADGSGSVARSTGYRLRLPAVDAPFAIAAFGPAAIRVAARHADTLLLNMLTPKAVARLHHDVVAAAEAIGRPAPKVAIWLAAAVDPESETMAQLNRGKVAYLAAPGYREMFAEAGFGHVIELARRGAHPRELLAAIPPEMARSVGLVGSAGEIADRLDEYRDAGVDEVAIVPATAGDDDAVRTLTTLAPSLSAESPGGQRDESIR